MRTSSVRRAPAGDALHVLGAARRRPRPSRSDRRRADSARRRCSRRSRELAAQESHEERDVQDVQLVRQDLLREAAGNIVMVSKASEPQMSADMEELRFGVREMDRAAPSGIEHFDGVTADAQRPPRAAPAAPAQHPARAARPRRGSLAAPSTAARQQLPGKSVRLNSIDGSITCRRAAIAQARPRGESCRRRASPSAPCCRQTMSSMRRGVPDPRAARHFAPGDERRPHRRPSAPRACRGSDARSCNASPSRTARRATPA